MAAGWRNFHSEFERRKPARIVSDDVRRRIREVRHLFRRETHSVFIQKIRRRGIQDLLRKNRRLRPQTADFPRAERSRNRKEVQARRIPQRNRRHGSVLAARRRHSVRVYAPEIRRAMRPFRRPHGRDNVQNGGGRLGHEAAVLRRAQRDLPVRPAGRQNNVHAVGIRGQRGVRRKMPVGHAPRRDGIRGNLRQRHRPARHNDIRAANARRKGKVCFHRRPALSAGAERDGDDSRHIKRNPLGIRDAPYHARRGNTRRKRLPF